MACWLKTSHAIKLIGHKKLPRCQQRNDYFSCCFTFAKCNEIEKEQVGFALVGNHLEH